jgi:D-alanine-D-alanine ligase
MRVAVIQGGPSAEAEVSRRSAAGVAAALGRAGHGVERLELGPSLARALGDGGFDAAFPATHGALGEDGALQGMLEILGVPYVGSGVLASATAMHKPSAKRAFGQAGLPLAADATVLHGEPLGEAARRVRGRLGRGVVVKPASQGSAIGVALVAEDEPDASLERALADALRYDDVVLCERFVRGREVTCGVLEAPALGGLRAFPPTEIFSKAASWYDFASRYAQGGSAHRCPADLGAELSARVQQIACAAHRAIGCRDLSRVDFVVGDGDDPSAVTLLEVNTLPGMTATSLFPEAAAAAGIAFDVLCDALVRGAQERARSVARPDPVPIP